MWGHPYTHIYKYIHIYKYTNIYIYTCIDIVNKIIDSINPIDHSINHTHAQHNIQHQHYIAPGKNRAVTRADRSLGGQQAVALVYRHHAVQHAHVGQEAWVVADGGVRAVLGHQLQARLAHAVCEIDLQKKVQKHAHGVPSLGGEFELNARVGQHGQGAFLIHAIALAYHSNK